MAIDDDKKSCRLLLLKWSSRDKAISKKNRNSSRKIQPTLSSIHGKMLLDQFCNGSAMKEGGSICKCGLFIDPAPSSLPVCRYCLKFDKDLMTGLPKFVVVNHCHSCGKYYSGLDNCHQTSPPSPDLLNFLIVLLQYDLYKFKLFVLSAHFSHPMAVSNNSSIKINVTVEKHTPSGDRLERTCVVEYLIRVLECRLCRLTGPARPWNSEVQLRPYGSRSCRGHLLKSVDRALMLAPRNRAVNLRMSDQGVDVFFLGQQSAKRFIVTISMFAPTKLQETLSFDDQTYTPVSICPIRNADLVFLPSVPENTGHLLVCTKVNASITLLNPFTLSECVLSPEQYWDSPFEAVKTRDELVEFTVLNVQSVSKEKDYSLANVEVARVTEFGCQKDVRFSVRSHLGGVLKPGDVVLGYDLHGANVAGVVILPDVVLLEKKDDKLMTKPEKNCSEYCDFLRDLEKNPEAMFYLSLNDDKKGKTTDMNMASVGRVGQNVEFDLENYLASLGLSDGEDGDPIQRE